MYDILPLRTVLKHIPEMKRLGVSEVARAPGGFIPAYKRAKYAGELPSIWLKRRAAFIARHIAQYKKNPTYRRYLALIAWAYKPKRIPKDIGSVSF